MLNISLPVGVVVSMAWIENLQPHALGVEALPDLAQMRDAAGKAVELGDHEHVTLSCVVESSFQLLPLG
jgi:hypothetical protein